MTDLQPQIFRYKHKELAYLDMGPRDGHPVIFFHGFPGSSYQSLSSERYLSTHRLRLLAFDRPGYGYSSSATRHDYRFFVEALEAFLDSHRMPTVDLLGVSGGAPYALAAAAAWKNRVPRIAIICGLNILTPHKDQYLSEFQAHTLRLVRTFPTWQIEVMINFLLSKFNPIDKIDSFLQRLDPKDQLSLRRPQMKRILLDSLEIARYHGPSGIIYDGKNYSMDWDVNLSDITATTYIFHGTEDRILNYRMAEELAQHIPEAHLKLFPGEGHYSLATSRINEILHTIFKAQNRRQERDLESSGS